MLFLRPIDKLLITTTSSSLLDYVVVIGPPHYGEYNDTIASATTTVITPNIIPNGQYGMVASVVLLSAGSNTITIQKRVGTIAQPIFKASLSAGDLVIFDGANWKVLDSSGKLKVTTATGGGGGGADGGNILAAGTQTADSTGTVVFQNGNGITFGMDSNTITASYTVPNTTQFQHSSLMTNYLGTTYTSHTHSQYLNTSQSSLFQNTSLMSNYLGTSYTSHTHSQYLNTSQSSLFQHTSAMSDYLGANYTTHTHSNYVNTSQSSLFQNTSLMSDYLGTTYTSHTHTQLAQAVSASNTSVTFQTVSFGDSNGLSFYITNGSVVGSYTVPIVSDFLNSSQSSLFQQTSLMSDYLGTSYTTHTHAQSVQTQNMVSVEGSTGNIWFEDGNGITFGGTASTITASYTVPATTQLLQTSQSSLFQHTSLMIDYLGTSYTTHTHSQYVNTSQSSLFQQTSLMTNYLQTGYTTHTHSQYVNTSVTSNFLTSQTVQPVAASASNGSFNFSTLKFVETNGVTFATSTDGIRASVQTNYVPTGNSTLFQHTSLMSDYLGTAYTSHTHSQYVNTSISSRFQQTSQMSDYLGTNYTTHTHAAQPVAASGSNGSFLFSTLSFGNLNGMSFYTSNGSIVASYTDGGGGGGGGIALANSQTTFGANTVHLAAAGAMTIASTTGQSFQFSVPGTSSLSATGVLSISVNSNTISIGVPAADTHSGYAPFADLPMVAQTHGAGTLVLDPEYAPNVTFDRMVIPMAMSNASNSSGSHTISFWAGFYTNNAGTLSLLHSASASTAMTMSGTAGSYSLYSGMRIFTMGYSQSLSEGQYWMAFLSRTTSGGANGSYSVMAASQINSNFVGHFGSSHNTKYQLTKGQGVYSVTTSALPNSINFSQIRGSDSAGLRFPAIMLANSTV